MESFLRHRSDASLGHWSRHWVTSLQTPTPGITMSASHLGSHPRSKDLTPEAINSAASNSIGYANRSCGPPKLGRLLLSGVQQCRRRCAGVRWVPMGPQRARGDAVGSRMGPYINRAPIWDSREICRAKTGFRRKPVGIYGPTGPDEPCDGSLDCPVSVYD